MKETLLRKLPAVDALIQKAEEKLFIDKFGREEVLKSAQRVLEDIRRSILEEKAPSLAEADLVPDRVLDEMERRLAQKLSPSLRNAINATGVIMHSGLGRAVLSRAAQEAILEASRGYCTLALDLETGRRSQRDAHVSRILCELTGAEAATVVNNNAAATVVILNSLARGKEVIISRGQLVEIGGSFRIPEVMATSGAILHEIGATNKTHLRDYENAIGPNTGAILRVHHSNYRIIGFAEEPGIEDLVKLGRARNIPVIDDIGSGALIDLKEFGLEAEPLIQHSVAAGVDVACFSGDKLIGGPQSGIIVGKGGSIQQIKKNPLVRAFRCGKLTLAAMEATLKLFLNPKKLREEHPIYRMFAADLMELMVRAERLKNELEDSLPSGTEVFIEDGGSFVGSGSVPTETLPTKFLTVKPRELLADDFARKLRFHEPPIFTRIQNDCVMFDLRTIQPDEDEKVCDAILKILKDKTDKNQR